MTSGCKEIRKPEFVAKSQFFKDDFLNISLKNFNNIHDAIPKQQNIPPHLNALMLKK